MLEVHLRMLELPTQHVDKFHMLNLPILLQQYKDQRNFCFIKEHFFLTILINYVILRKTERKPVAYYTHFTFMWYFFPFHKFKDI